MTSNLSIAIRIGSSLILFPKENNFEKKSDFCGSYVAVDGGTEKTSAGRAQ